MCFRQNSSACAVARKASCEEMEIILQNRRKQDGVDVEAAAFATEVVKAWVFWIALRSLHWSANPQDEALRIAERFIEEKLAKILLVYDVTKKLTPLCKKSILNECRTSYRTAKRRARIHRRIYLDTHAYTFNRKPRRRFAVEIEEEQRQVRAAVRGLPRRFRRAVILRDWLNATSKVGGRRLGVSAAKFNRWVHEGRRRVRKQLGDDYMDDVA